MSVASAPDSWAAQRTVGLHSSGGVGMQKGGVDVLSDPLLDGRPASDSGVILVVSDQGRKPTAGIITSSISYCNSVIGAGILGLPFAFSRTGWAWGCILLCINTVLCTVTMGMLEYCMRETDARTRPLQFDLFALVAEIVETYAFSETPACTVSPGTYSEAIFNTCGWGVKVAGEIFMILNFWGTMIAYQQIVPGSLLDILEDRQVLDPADTNFFWPGFLDNRQWLVAMTTLFLFLPLSLAPSVDCLAGVSAFATAAMVYMIAIVAKNAFARFAQEDGTGVPPLACLDGGPDDCGNLAAVAFNINSELFDSFATFSFALAGHGIVAVVRGELINPTGTRFAMVVLPCMAVVTLLYAVAAVMGYLQFTNWSCANVSEAYTDDNWVFVGQIGVVLCITGGHPVNMFPLKIAVDKLFFFDKKESNIRRGIISVVCVLTAGAVAIVVDDLSDVLSLSGAIGNGPVCFAIPAIAYMNLRHPGRSLAQRLFCTWEGWVAIVLTAFVMGTIVVVIVNIATLGPSDGEEPDRRCGTVCETLPAGECGNGAAALLSNSESWWTRFARLLSIND